MFVDYYALLELEMPADAAQIKQAFRQQALKWHPDRHPNKDTTERMKAINEAYLVLKDPIARARYDRTYQEFCQSKTSQTKANNTNTSTQQKNKEQHYYYNYDIKDAVLKTWMERARAQAANLVKQTIEDFRGMTIAGAKGVVKGAGTQLIAQLVVSLLFVLCFSLARACSS